MANWKEEKRLAEDSIKTINNHFYSLAMNGSHGHQYKLEIKTSGYKRLLKKVYDDGKPISQGLETWREVVIFLSGLRIGAMQ